MRLATLILVPILGWLILPIAFLFIGISPTPLGIGWTTHGLMIVLPPDAHGNDRYLHVIDDWRWRWGYQTEILKIELMVRWESDNSLATPKLLVSPTLDAVISEDGLSSDPQQSGPLSAELMSTYLVRILPDVPDQRIRPLATDIVQFLNDVAASGGSGTYFDEVVEGMITVNELQPRPNGPWPNSNSRVLLGSTWIDGTHSYPSIGPVSWATPILYYGIITSLILTPLVEIGFIVYFRWLNKHAKKLFDKSK
ncbi:MAG: hypothetical protein K8E66_01940 [Phycisphaerales bacterium]|nr:hypothetical protein [Phycisphaerales bacterium]